MSSEIGTTLSWVKQDQARSYAVVGFCLTLRPFSVLTPSMKTTSSLRKLLQPVLATLAIAIVSGLSVRPTQAGYIVTLQEVGSNVVATGSGAIDLTDLIDGSGNKVSYMDPFNGSILTGPATLTSIDEYRSVHGPANFGTHPGTENADSGSGDLVGIVNAFFLDVPSGYMSGNPLSGSSTYDSATFGTLGVTPGTYVWTWGTGEHADSFTLIASVPDSGSTLGLLLVSLLALVGASRFRSPRQA
jgi:VPDSG-CTERM motif